MESATALSILNPNSDSHLRSTFSPQTTLHEEIALDILDAKDPDSEENVVIPHLASAIPARPTVPEPLAMGLPLGLGVDLENISPAVAHTQATLTDPAPVRTKAQRRLVKIQFAAISYAHFVCGWNDGSTGALLPRIQKVYHVGFVVVSLLFVLSCIGSISGGISNVPLTDKLGYGKIVVLAAICQLVAFTIQSTAPPFPLFVISFAINGFGMAINEAQGNNFVINMANNAGSFMGILHASYSAGALLSPLVATQFAQARHWSFHYLCSLGFAASNTLTLIAAFRLKHLDECMRDAGLVVVSQEPSGKNESKFKHILGMKGVHILACFAFVYVGLEVTIGGWIVSFLIDVRHGGPSSGYVSAGFFGGLMLGRVGLVWLTSLVGEQRVLYLYSFLVMSLEFVVWFVPSIVGDAVAVSLAGLFLGPIFPIVMNVTGRILPRKILIGSIGWISSFGAVGSAALPFMTGALASKVGIKSLQPLLIGMLTLMIVLWTFAPRKRMHMD